ncbi:MAG: DUF4912 domain-containing protein [Treponema sp.]|nr:DUF4912 domain-containing protein [Treponema sp.]
MDNNILTRAHLETLSFKQLTELADEYGLDVPENFDRLLLIGELLEVAEDYGNLSDEMEGTSVTTAELPKNYNETQIFAVLQNPAFAFVFWNLNEVDVGKIKKAGGNLMLRVCSLDNPEDQKPAKAFEIQTISEKQEQYVLLPARVKYVRIELVSMSATSGTVLASAPVLKIPEGSALLENAFPGFGFDLPEITLLSGMEEMITAQYKNYRQSFSR